MAQQTTTEQQSKPETEGEYADDKAKEVTSGQSLSIPCFVVFQD